MQRSLFRSTCRGIFEAQVHHPAQTIADTLEDQIKLLDPDSLDAHHKNIESFLRAVESGCRICASVANSMGKRLSTDMQADQDGRATLYSISAETGNGAFQLQIRLKFQSSKSVTYFDMDPRKFPRLVDHLALG